MLNEPPIRVCCMTRHNGVVCPDGRVMCCICFERVHQEHLAIIDGDKYDVCKPCRVHEIERQIVRDLAGVSAEDARRLGF